MSKGSVYFVNTQKLDRIYARVTVSRSAITHIAYTQTSRLFLTICEELNLTVSLFERLIPSLGVVLRFKQRW